MKKKIIAAVLCALVVIGVAVGIRCSTAGGDAAAAFTSGGFIKYVEFNVPTSALSQAMRLDISTHAGPAPVHWVEALAYLAAQYGGNWKRYRSRDLTSFAQKLKDGKTIQELTANMKYYSYYYEAYDAVLGNFLGDYEEEVSENTDDGSHVCRHAYGLKVFSPIARNYGYSHYDDFGDSRSFGFRRRHLGNDLIGGIGTPIVAVEGGTVECLGWNRYGGWRIGIRSFDKKRYYYYAHLRKNHPYHNGLKQGDIVKSGDVIGYLGMTGYSEKENVNNMTVPHLHFGMELVFDESQKECDNEIWINVYNIINLLYSHRSTVKKDIATKDYNRTCSFVDCRYKDYYEQKSGSKVP